MRHDAMRVAVQDQFGAVLGHDGLERARVVEPAQPRRLAAAHRRMVDHHHPGEASGLLQQPRERVELGGAETAGGQKRHRSARRC